MKFENYMRYKALHLLKRGICCLFDMSVNIRSFHLTTSVVSQNVEVNTKLSSKYLPPALAGTTTEG